MTTLPVIRELIVKIYQKLLRINGWFLGVVLFIAPKKGVAARFAAGTIRTTTSTITADFEWRSPHFLWTLKPLDSETLKPREARSRKKFEFLLEIELIIGVLWLAKRSPFSRARLI